MEALVKGNLRAKRVRYIKSTTIKSRDTGLVNRRVRKGLLTS